MTDDMKTEIEWIPVERELPLVGNRFYRVKTGDGTVVHPHLWVGSRWWDIDTDCLPPFRWNKSVTHWAHLPKHPGQLEEGK